MTTRNPDIDDLLERADGLVQSMPGRTLMRELVAELADTIRTLTTPTTGNYRAGHTLGRTIYRHDDLIGIMDTPELGAMVVDALNRTQAEAPQPRVLWQGETKATDAGDTRSYIAPPSFAGTRPGTRVRVIEDTETPKEDDAE